MRTVIVFLLVILFPSLGLAHHTDPPSAGSYTKHYEQSLFKVTGKGLFSVEMVIKEKVRSDVNSGHQTFHAVNRAA
jgi:hypothetical protein